MPTGKPTTPARKRAQIRNFHRFRLKGALQNFRNIADDPQLSEDTQRDLHELQRLTDELLDNLNYKD